MFVHDELGNFVNLEYIVWFSIRDDHMVIYPQDNVPFMFYVNPDAFVAMLKTLNMVQDVEDFQAKGEL